MRQKLLKNRAFLLGGGDLEMLTISEMLKDRDEAVCDHGLEWNNALLSSYSDELQSQSCDTEIYGIELREDITPPCNYHSIDHHNKYSNKPSSLEQVASIIGVQLTRWQQLVAANDSGYIPALERMDATQEEIAYIRQADRRTQGITPHDEELAEKAINNKENHCDLIIVRALSHHFSPICDRLYKLKKDMLIYDDAGLCYYGSEQQKFINLYAKEIEDGVAFYGGTGYGYFGIDLKKNSPDEIKKYVETIKSFFQ